MTFDASETGLTTGEPLELYRFAQGSEVIRQTSADRGVVFDDGSGPEAYTQEAIDRGEPTQSAEGKPSALELVVRRDHPIALKFRIFVPAATMSVTIFRVHRGALGDFIVFWKGLVRSVAWDDNFARIACEAIDGATKVDGLRFQYQAICNHMLFGPGCNLAAGPFTRVGTITDITGDTITATIFGAEAAGWFNGGVAEVNGDRRMIIGTAGNVATLLLPFESAIVGDTVNALPGCDRYTLACDVKFANLANYGGFPQLPTNNPFSVGIEGQQSGTGYVSV